MAIFPSFDTLLKAILLPGSIALALYLAAIYILYPLYTRRQRYAHYLPVSLDAENSHSFVGRTRNGISRVLEPVRNTGLFLFFQVLAESLPFAHSRRRRAMSFDSYFGDEELDDGVLSSGQNNAAAADRRESSVEQDSERRLSRELEAGFRDDSDSDDQGEDERGRSLR